VETFHVASECNTAVYYCWCVIQAFAQPVQLFWLLVTFSVASHNSLTDSDLQLFIETEQDRTRHIFIQYLSEICSIPNKSDQICLNVKNVRKYVLCSLVARSWHRPQFIHGLLRTQALENKTCLAGQLIIE